MDSVKRLACRFREVNLFFFFLYSVTFAITHAKCVIEIARNAIDLD